MDASRPGEVFYLIDDGEDTTVEVPKWVTKLVKELPWIVCTIGSFIVGSMFGFGSGLVPQF